MMERMFRLVRYDGVILVIGDITVCEDFYLTD